MQLARLKSDFMSLKDKILKRIKGAYGLRVGATAIGLSGAFLFFEHTYMWGINDTFGHEHIGLILIGVSYLIAKASNKVE